MIRTSRAALLGALLLCGSQAVAADPSRPAAQSAQEAALPVAHSALLTIDATHADDALNLHIRRVSDKSIVHSEDVSVSVDGKSQITKQQSDGSYQLATADLQGDGTREVEIIVGHDGIREILAGKLALPETSTASSLLRDHKQIYWWILNIVIVLIAAIAISRRKG